MADTPTTIEGTLRALLGSSDEIKAVVTGDDGAVHIYPAPIPEEVTAAALSFSRTGTDRPSAMGVDIELPIGHFLISCWGRSQASGSFASYDDAKALADAVRHTIKRYRDYAGANGVQIEDIFLDDEFDDYDKDAQAHGVQCKYRIIWRES